MSALTGHAVGPLGHERRHQAAALREHLHEGLEQRGAIGRFEGLAVRERRLEHSRSGFGMQSLDRKAHVLAERENLRIQFRVHRTAQHRIAERPRCHGFQVPVALVAHRLGRLLEHEEFELGRGAHRIAEAGRPLEHPPQGAARTDRFGAAGEFPKEQGRLRFVGNLAARGRQDAHRRIGIGGVPAGVLDIVEQLVVRIPAEDHVAEADPLVERRQELVAAEIFAAHDAVAVEHADLDVLDPSVAQKCGGIDGVLHVKPKAAKGNARRPVLPAIVAHHQVA